MLRSRVLRSSGTLQASPPPESLSHLFPDTATNRGTPQCPQGRLCRDCSCPHLRPVETEQAPSRRRPPAFLTWYCAAGPAGPMGRKAAAPGTPMPPEGPGPRRAGLGSIPGPAGGGGAPRAAATAPPPGLSGGNGNPPAPRPDIALSRPAVQRSGLRAVSVESAPRAAFRDPGLSDFMAGFRDFLFQVRQVLHGPAFRSCRGDSRSGMCCQPAGLSRPPEV